MKNKRRLFSIACAVILLPFLGFGQDDGCKACHGQMEDELLAPVTALADDIHAEYGLSCHDCHGGNPKVEDLDLAKDRTFRGVPGRSQIPSFCGECHADAAAMRAFNPALRTDQLSQYKTSEHGRAVEAGDPKAAVCTDCHGVHGIQSAKFPRSKTFPWNIPETCAGCHGDEEYMGGYGIPTDQLEEYQESVHYQALHEKNDLSAPTCNDCHGNHGASPPEVSSVAAVCHQCHPSAGDLFTKSPHKEAFDAMGIAECEACHGNHKIIPPTTEMIGADDGSVCMQCHDSGSSGSETAAEIRRLLDGFDEGYHNAEDLIHEAESKGVEVSDARFMLQDANTILVTVKNLIHGLDRGEIAAAVEDGENKLGEVQAAGERALKEARFRRQGLAVTTLFLILLAAAIALKVKRMNLAKRRT